MFHNQLGSRYLIVEEPEATGSVPIMTAEDNRRSEPKGTEDIWYDGLQSYEVPLIQGYRCLRLALLRLETGGGVKHSWASLNRPGKSRGYTQVRALRD